MTKRHQSHLNSPELTSARAQDPLSEQDERIARFFIAVLQDQLPELAPCVYSALRNRDPKLQLIFAEPYKYPPSYDGGRPQPLNVLRSLFRNNADEMIIFPTDAEFFASYEAVLNEKQTDRLSPILTEEDRLARFAHFCICASQNPSLTDELRLAETTNALPTVLAGQQTPEPTSCVA